MFEFELNQRVQIAVSGEAGYVIARAQYANSENAYLVRYKTADGNAKEFWWGESALTSA